MTGVSEFTYVQHPSPATSAARDAVLAAPGFGKHFTDHMVSIDYTRDGGWHDARITPYGPIELDPAAMVLHYGQAIFEGLKVYRQPNGDLSTFRVQSNAERFRTSAKRLAMPEMPEVQGLVDFLAEQLAGSGVEMLKKNGAAGED